MPERQILFLSHGGGPLPLLGDPAHEEMVECLADIGARLRKPAAILVISAHWEAARPTLTAAAHPPLIYDYYGFPDEAYSITYPCPGHPVLAEAVKGQLCAAGLEATLDDSRGFDHGLFVPLKMLFPDADIPCVQLSLVSSLDPALHVRMGEALAGLAFDDLLIIGSGFSFHNMKAFFAPPTDEMQAHNAAFEDWLVDTCSNPALAERDRYARLVNWAQAPHARFCHPREEHLLPLHVCYGAARQACQRTFRLTVLNKFASMYLW